MGSQEYSADAAPNTSSATDITIPRQGYLFGYPIAHSYSPLLHQTIFAALGIPWNFGLLESLEIPQLLDLLKNSSDLYGSAVTMPHKIAIIPHLDDLTDEGRCAGAVNTIFRRGNQLVGTNTDIIGVRESFFQNVPEPERVFHNRPGLVVGGGGAARSAVAALVNFMKCKNVYLVNRDPAEVEAVISWCKSQGYGDGLIHVSSSAQAEELDAPGAIVTCVPNFPPKTEAEILARQIFEVFLSKAHKGALLEMCYHPTPWTELGALAEKAGWQVILGTEAMIYQGIEQHKFWHGKPVEDQTVQKIKGVISRELAQRKS